MKKFMPMFLAGLLLLAGPGAALGQPATGDFADIKGHWGETAIREVCDQGVMQGMGIDQQGLRIFIPDGTVTRAQAAAVLTQTFKLDYGSQRFIKQPLASDYYQDVDNQAWYASAAVMCAINKILNDGDQFFPEQSITRMEMARAIKGSFDAKGMSIPMIMVMPIYDDIDQLSPEDVQVIAFVTNTGIMKGDDGCFRPEETLTRAELAQIFRQCLSVIQSQMTIDEAYNGHEYRVAPGQEFVLSLESNPTTGYQWTFSNPVDKKILSEPQHEFRSAASATHPAVVGQGGRDYWTFKALQPGTTELKLVYSRPWESKMPIRTFTVEVIVNSVTAPETNTEVPVPGLEPDVTISSQTIKDQTDNISIDLQIPALSGLKNEPVQSALNSKWEKDARDFQEEIASNLEDYVKECREQGYPVRPYEVMTRCQVGSQSQDRLSLYVDYYQYTGGAHGLTERRAYNIDLKTGKELTLKDLFPEGSNYREEINQFIEKQINAHPENYFTDPEMGGFTGIAEDQSFYLEDDYLVIYFGLYEIAPYASGIPEFRIPLNQLV